MVESKNKLEELYRRVSLTLHKKLCKLGNSNIKIYGGDVVESKNKFEELYRRVSLTSKARYSASRRLQLHKVMSQWTVTLITVGLITISVLAISPIACKLNFSLSYVAVMQIVFSVLILAYTLLLSLGDYSARAVKIHRCGMELGKIARELKPYLNEKGDDEKYKNFVNEYYQCLEKYENHESCDYIEASLSKFEACTNKEGWKSIVCGKIKYTKYLCMKYFPAAHYFIVLGMVYTWILFLVLK